MSRTSPPLVSRATLLWSATHGSDLAQRAAPIFAGQPPDEVSQALSTLVAVLLVQLDATPEAFGDPIRIETFVALVYEKAAILRGSR